MTRKNPPRRRPYALHVRHRDEKSQLEAQETFAPLYQTRGVNDVVRLGSGLTPIDSVEIEAMGAIVSSDVSGEPYPNLALGDRVLMRGGPFDGLSGTLVQVRDTLRLVVSLELLTRAVLVEIDRDWVAPVPDSKLE
jgi:transcription antitermination factor NusG